MQIREKHLRKLLISYLLFVIGKSSWLLYNIY